MWSYAGEALYSEKYDELYQVLAQPAPAGLYPNRPQSPRLSDKRKADAAAGVAAAPAKPTAYIPPHLRARGATAPSSIMKRENESAPRKLNVAERAAITGETLPEQDGGVSTHKRTQTGRQSALATSGKCDEARRGKRAIHALAQHTHPLSLSLFLLFLLLAFEESVEAREAEGCCCEEG